MFIKNGNRKPKPIFKCTLKYNDLKETKDIFHFKKQIKDFLQREEFEKHIYYKFKKLFNNHDFQELSDLRKGFNFNYRVFVCFPNRTKNHDVPISVYILHKNWLDLDHKANNKNFSINKNKSDTIVLDPEAVFPDNMVYSKVTLFNPTTKQFIQVNSNNVEQKLKNGWISLDNLNPVIRDKTMFFYNINVFDLANKKLIPDIVFSVNKLNNSTLIKVQLFNEKDEFVVNEYYTQNNLEELNKGTYKVLVDDDYIVSEYQLVIESHIIHGHNTFFYALKPKL